MTQETLLINGSDVRRLLTLEQCIAAVEAAFRIYGEGRAPAPGVLGIHSCRGGFHIKAGALDLERSYFAAKVNGNFPDNREHSGLPTIQGLIVLADAENGFPLAVMDSIEVTALRTAAATAVAAKYLARKDSHVVTVSGCGFQARFQLSALASVLPLTEAFAYDIDKDRANQFSADAAAELGFKVTAVAELIRAACGSDVIVTCTSSRRPFLEPEHVKPGTLVAAVGADNPEKQEIAPALMADSKVVVDVIEQCVAIGDLHHAIEVGLMRSSDIHAQLGEIVAGKRPARTSDKETFIFDSTGAALQDVAAAVAVYRKALEMRHKRSLNFAG